MDARNRRKRPTEIILGDPVRRNKVDVIVRGPNRLVVLTRDGGKPAHVLDRREARELRDFLNHFIEWDAEKS